MNPIAALYAFWMGIPAPVREPIKSAVVSFSWSLQNLAAGLYAGYVVLQNNLGQPQTFGGFLHFVAQTWFVTAAGLLAAAYRARQAHDRVNNTVPVASGGSAVLSAAPPPSPETATMVLTAVPPKG